MFVELIEYLRCPRPHEESLLVAAATRSANRRILEGALGCPVCSAEFPITGGVARFASAVPAVDEPARMEAAMRLAAFLELSDARGFALLCGARASHAAPLAGLVETPLVLVNPAPSADVEAAAAVIQCGAVLPMAAGSARAMAFDARQPFSLETAVHAVRRGGRVLAPADAPVPGSVRELARDAEDWVGEATSAPGAAPRLVPLRRA